MLDDTAIPPSDPNRFIPWLIETNWNAFSGEVTTELTFRSSEEAEQSGASVADVAINSRLKEGMMIAVAKDKNGIPFASVTYQRTPSGWERLIPPPLAS